MTNHHNHKRIKRKEYAVFTKEVRETWDGKKSHGTWEFRGIAPTIEQCYVDIIGPEYPDDYDNLTIFPPRISLRRRDPQNPHLRPYDIGAIFECLIFSNGSWARGDPVENF